jgi:hypothetical protein
VALEIPTRVGKPGPDLRNTGFRVLAAVKPEYRGVTQIVNNLRLTP